MTLASRPNTLRPTQTVVIDREELRYLENAEIADLAWRHLGVDLDPSWERPKLLAKFLGLATRL